MYTATIIPFDGDESPASRRQFADLDEAVRFAKARTKQDWSTVRIWTGEQFSPHNVIAETSHACGKNDFEDRRTDEHDCF